MRLTRYAIGGLLLVSAVNLGVMVPGGPVETRVFSQNSLWVIGIFNVFLTALAISSIGVAYMLLVKQRHLYLVTSVLGVSYFVVYALDLMEIFPVSTDAMPPMLERLETWGAILAVVLTTFAIVASFIHQKSERANVSRKPSNKWSLALAFVVVVVASGIVIFATLAALG